MGTEELHIVPVKEKELHAESENCWCDPLKAKLEGEGEEWAYVHNTKEESQND